MKAGRSPNGIPVSRPALKYAFRCPQKPDSIPRDLGTWTVSIFNDSHPTSCPSAHSRHLAFNLYISSYASGRYWSWSIEPDESSVSVSATKRKTLLTSTNNVDETRAPFTRQTLTMSTARRATPGKSYLQFWNKTSELTITLSVESRPSSSLTLNAPLARCVNVIASGWVSDANRTPICRVIKNQKPVIQSTKKEKRVLSSANWCPFLKSGDGHGSAATRSVPESSPIDTWWRHYNAQTKK